MSIESLEAVNLRRGNGRKRKEGNQIDLRIQEPRRRDSRPGSTQRKPHSKSGPH